MALLPTFYPAAFTPGAPIDNPLLPLTPGAVQTSYGTATDPVTGETLTQGNDVFVTLETADTAGVSVVVVRDTAYDDGVLVEDTVDWFAEDDAGNVWYLGERVNNYLYDADGRWIGTDHDGSWQAGADGALPGWIMKAQPATGDAYFQEFAPDIAVDQAVVDVVDLSITIAGTAFGGVLRTLESSALDPGVFDFKYYAPGVGLVRTEEKIDEDGVPELTVERVGTRNAGGEAPGALPQRDSFEGDGDRFRVDVSSVDTDATNALGAYTYDLTTGVIGEAFLVFSAIEPGVIPEAASIRVAEGRGLGLFLVPDADATGIDLAMFEDEPLRFAHIGTAQPATLQDSQAPLVLDADGTPLPIQAFHALGSDGNFNPLNPGAGVNAIVLDNALEADTRGRNTVVLGFEDRRVTEPGYDGDFNDLVVAVRNSSGGDRGGDDEHDDEAELADRTAGSAFTVGMDVVSLLLPSADAAAVP